jgi:hypothetical protein
LDLRGYQDTPQENDNGQNAHGFQGSTVDLSGRTTF